MLQREHESTFDVILKDLRAEFDSDVARRFVAQEEFEMAL